MEIWWVSWLPSSKWQCLLQLHGSTDHCGFCARARIHRCIVSFECFDVAGRHGYADRWPCSASARKSQLSRWFYAILMFMLNSQWSSTLDVRLCIIKNLYVILMFYWCSMILELHEFWTWAVSAKKVEPAGPVHPVALPTSPRDRTNGEKWEPSGNLW